MFTNYEMSETNNNYSLEKFENFVGQQQALLGENSPKPTMPTGEEASNTGSVADTRTLMDTVTALLKQNAEMLRLLQINSQPPPQTQQVQNINMIPDISSSI